MSEKKKNIVIILGTAHRMREPGKQSPDGRLKECVYSREVVSEIAAKLRSCGYRVEIDYEPLDLPKTMQSPSYKQERSNELAMRVNYVNEMCRQHGTRNVIYVSVHVNAAGSDGKWHVGTGWEAITSVGQTKADKLADCLYEAAKRNFSNVKIRTDYSDGDPDKEAHLFVLKNTKCPAVLTENLFQDNREDVDYLLTDEGRHAIARIHVEGIIKYIESL
ncbi:MAG: N-acetylmuramoyl-L-alanine amidase [Prevotella sp.]|nr:N-acetylmuramoyl-L-alanine amidase [Prevotella sp.]